MGNTCPDDGRRFLKAQHGGTVHWPTSRVARAGKTVIRFVLNQSSRFPCVRRLSTLLVVSLIVFQSVGSVVSNGQKLGILAHDRDCHRNRHHYRYRHSTRCLPPEGEDEIEFSVVGRT